MKQELQLAPPASADGSARSEIVSLLIAIRTGAKPNKRTFETIQFYLLGWVSEAEFADHLKSLADPRKKTRYSLPRPPCTLAAAALHAAHAATKPPTLIRADRPNTRYNQPQSPLTHPHQLPCRTELRYSGERE